MGLDAQIDVQQAALADSRARASQQQAALAASEQELGTLRARLQDITVLRVSVLEKLRQALAAQLGPSADAAAEPVTLTDNGNLVLSEKLLFEYGSYAIKDDAKPLLDSLARALAGVLDDPGVRAPGSRLLDCAREARRRLCDGELLERTALYCKRGILLLNLPEPVPQEFERREGGDPGRWRCEQRAP